LFRLKVLLPDEEVSDVLGHEVVHPALHQGRVHLLVIDDLPEKKRNSRQYEIVQKVSHLCTLFSLTSGQREQVKAVLRISIGFNADPNMDPAF
jgi:hypothetical protein